MNALKVIPLFFIRAILMIEFDFSIETKKILSHIRIYKRVELFACRDIPSTYELFDEFLFLWMMIRELCRPTRGEMMLEKLTIEAL